MKTKKHSISDKLVAGERLARLSYLTVVNPNVHVGNGEYQVEVINESGKQWRIDKYVLDNECISASQFSTTKKVSRTDIVKLITNAGHRLFTAYFYTKPDKKKALQKLKNAYPNKGIKGVGIMKRVDYDKLMSEILDEVWHGNERTMVARYHSITPLGRINVVDVDKGGLRKIDPRTIEWLILDNVKYEV